MWQCKGCSVAVPSRLALLNHYKLKHPHFGRTSHYPCTYSECPCTFKTWNALIVHQSRVHSTQESQTLKDLTIFSCHLCSCKNLANEREYFVHINSHLKKNVNVSCMFSGCSFQTCIYGTFKAHKSRRHTPRTLADFKPGIVKTTTVASLSLDHSLPDGLDEDCIEEDSSGTSVNWNEDKALSGAIEQQFAAALLKLEYLVHVPGTAIDEFLQEVYHLISSASVPVSRSFVTDILKRNNLQVADSVVEEITTAICASNPVPKAIEKGGPLATSYQRKQYYKEKFSVVEPFTYILDHKKKQSFQYVPLLKSLQQILNRKNILDKVIENHRGKEDINLDPSFEYTSPKDGWHFKKNCFLNADELRISLCLYVDDFETCNPLGTSRKKTQTLWCVLDISKPSTRISLIFIIYLSCRALQK